MTKHLAQISEMYFSPSQQDKARLTSSFDFIAQAGAATLLLVNLGRGLIGVGRCWYCRTLTSENSKHEE